MGEGGEEKEDWRGGESPFIQEENKTLSLLASPRLENYLLPIKKKLHYFYFYMKLFGSVLLIYVYTQPDI